MILVTGATGQLGSAVIEQLLNKTDAGNIAAFARDAQKARPLSDRGIDVRTGTFDDTASLDEAMKGIETVLLVSTVDHQRLQQHQNVVDAAKKAGVKHIAYTGVSFEDLDRSALKDLMDSHFQTEDYIRGSGLAYTFLRNTLYMDMIPIYVGERVFETGIRLPAGDGKVAYALRSEMGEATANALLQAGNESKTYGIAGGELYSYRDVAAVLSELSGKEVRYEDVDAAQKREELKQAGVPEFLASLIVNFATDTRDHRFEIVSSDLEHLLGRKPAGLKEGLKALYKM